MVDQNYENYLAIVNEHILAAVKTGQAFEVTI